MRQAGPATFFPGFTEWDQELPTGHASWALAVLAVLAVPGLAALRRATPARAAC